MGKEFVSFPKCLLLDNESLDSDTPSYLGSEKKGKVSEKLKGIKGKIPDSHPLSLPLASAFKSSPPPPSQVLPPHFPLQLP